MFLTAVQGVTHAMSKIIIKTVRLQIVLPAWLKNELAKASEELGISMSEFIKDAIKAQLNRMKNGGG